MPREPLPTKSVRVSEGYALGVCVPDTSVELAPDGTVTHDGTVIGRVEKGYRTYAPPTHRGSRIVRYRKKVPEWHGYTPNQRSYQPSLRRDTRQEVLRDLLAKASL